MRRGVAAAVVVALAAPAASAALATPAPGYAAAATRGGPCAGARSVSVVVDPDPTAAGAEVACDPEGGGRTAAELFERSGFPLGHVAQQPGMVCRVDDRPADASCAGSLDPDAYWSLWWSDGEEPWVYATLGVDALTVPAGGAVAFSWDGVPGQQAPGVPVPEATGAEPPAAAEAAAEGETESKDEAAGLPGWVAPAAIGLLVAGVGTVALRRRSARS